MKRCIAIRRFSAVAVVLLLLGVLGQSQKLGVFNETQFGFDNLNRIVEIRYSDKIVHYTYDNAGNRTGVTVDFLTVVPSIIGLTPRGAVVGSSGLTLRVIGSNFANSSVVQWNGQNRTTTFISNNELSITLTPADIAAVGTAAVVVVNSMPSVSLSNAQSFSVVQTAAFSGRVTSGGVGLSNVAIDLAGTEEASASTDGKGNFNFAVLNNGSYTLTPSRLNYAFTPANLSVNYAGANQANLNFTASIVNYAISGRVARSNGSGVAGVAIALSGSQNGQTTTDNNGDYTINALAEGNYTITPTLVNNSFVPVSQSFNNLSSAQMANFTATLTVVPPHAPFDFDGDNKTDVSIFRPFVGEWWYLKSSDGGNGALQFGSSTDIMTPADYTGDGTADIAFFSPSTGFWFILRSEDFSFYSFPFGANGDIPVPADYDGDGKADPAVFRSASATWFILNSSGGTTIQAFGANGDRPVSADYDGDGKADLAIFRPSDGSWWLNRSQAGIIVLNFGTSTDKTVQGDYTGDGKADVAFFRPSSGEWFVSRSENFSFYSFPFGAASDIPAPGDYDGDGKIDPTVFRPSNSTWYKLQSTSGFEAITFGIMNDVPVPSAFVR